MYNKLQVREAYNAIARVSVSVNLVWQGINVIVARLTFTISSRWAALLANVVYRVQRATFLAVILSLEFVFAKKMSRENVVGSKFCYAISLNQNFFL